MESDIISTLRMTQKTEYIILNGIHYQKENVHLLSVNNTFSESGKQIFDFLTDWFDDSDVIITRTSGSTGTPKEIRLTKTAMRNSARMTNAFFGLDASKTALLCLPASYIAGKMMLVRAIVGGFNLMCVEPKANPFEDVDTEIDFTAITPYQLNHSAETLKTFPVKNIIVGGGHVNTRLEKLSETIPANLYETYGMTETASHIALRKINRDKSEYFCVLEGVSIQQDERGCLTIKALHLTENELITNDIVELKDEKSFKWLGRADSVINSGGVKIFPEQVEKKLEKVINNPFFVASLPDDTLGEKVILVIEGLEENYSDKLPAILGKYEMPKEIFFSPKFQYSISNKILKKETIETILTKLKH